MNRLTLLVPLALFACTSSVEDDGHNDTDGHTHETDSTDETDASTDETDTTDETDVDTDIAEVEVTEATGRSRTTNRFYSVDWTFSPFPLVAGETTLRIETLGTHVEVIPWMSVHGHGASGNTLESKGPGVWEATWTYTMAGDWEVTVTIDGAVGEDVVIFNTAVAEAVIVEM